MEKYRIDAKTSEETTDNFLSFYMEEDKVWISVGTMEERGFTIQETEEIIEKLKNCINKR